MDSIKTYYMYIWDFEMTKNYSLKKQKKNKMMIFKNQNEVILTPLLGS